MVTARQSQFVKLYRHFNRAYKIAFNRQKPKARNMTPRQVFGAPKELSDSVLPTCDSVVKCYMLLKHQLKSSGTLKEHIGAYCCEHYTAVKSQSWTDLGKSFNTNCTGIICSCSAANSCLPWHVYEVNKTTDRQMKSTRLSKPRCFLEESCLILPRARLCIFVVYLRKSTQGSSWSENLRLTCIDRVDEITL